MKIRELFETQLTSRAASVQLHYGFTCFANSIHSVRTKVDEIRSAIAKKASTNSSTVICIISTAQRSFTVSLIIPLSEIDSLSLYRADVLSVLNEYIHSDNIREDEDDHMCTLDFLGEFPKLPHKLSFENESIYINTYPLESSDKYSISGIDKYIGECNYLEICNAQNIVGGVLGIFRIKDAYQIRITFAKIKPEWVTIVEKHLKSKDILQCQEDLIDAGLKDYAKF